MGDSTIEIVAVGEVLDQEDEYDTDSGSDMDDDDHDSYPTQQYSLGLYSPRNDPDPEMIPNPEMIPKSTPK